MQHSKHKLKCLSVAIARRSVALALLYEEKRCSDLLFPAADLTPERTKHSVVSNPKVSTKTTSSWTEAKWAE